jgi:hypothetical protein
VKEIFRGDHSIIIFATNKHSYADMALKCAASILLFNNIKIYVITNLNITIPRQYARHINIIRCRPEYEPLGIEMKLHIDEYLQTEHTLFIDADCLCFGSLKDIFNAGAHGDVTVAGNVVAAATWCGREQAGTIKKRFGLDELIRYNGGLYRIKKNTATKKIFNKAREIAADYDNYGFSRINGKWINEEGPLSIAMMLNKQQPFADDGRYMTDLFTDRRPGTLNVLKGLANLKNPPLPSTLHRPWYPNKYGPVILHFGGSSNNSYPYNSQGALLKLNSFKLPVWLSIFLVEFFIHIPFKTYYKIFKR